MALVEDKTELDGAMPGQQLLSPTTTADFVIHTGNVQRCNHLQARVPASAQCEIVTALKCTMQCWKKHHQGDFVMTREVIGHPKLMRVPLPGNPHAKRVRVKLFVLDTFEEGMVSKAMTGVEKAVGFAGVDTLVADIKHEDTDSHAQELRAVWREMESLHDYGLAQTLGVADLNVDQLQDLASNAKVPVSVNEIDPCALRCSPPQSLRDYAHTNGVSLVAHSDAGHPLPKGQFHKIMTKVIKDQSIFTPAGELAAVDGRASFSSSSSATGTGTPSATSSTPTTDSSSPLRVDWTPRWVARYTVVDTERSVVDSTGYVVGGRYTV